MSSGLRRRDFLKLVGVAGASAPLGCSEPARKLIPYIYPADDVIPGKATWYATTCRECPAGCGMLAKNRDGRIIKVEGNPQHPVNTGKLCARGQASLHALYNPDRFRGPMRRELNGQLVAIGWDEAQALLAERLREIAAVQAGGRILFATELVNGVRRELVTRWLSALGQRNALVLYEPFAYEPLRAANQAVFAYSGIPTYRIDRADFLLSFGAGFLETWLSNVQYARQFAVYHGLGPHGKRPFVYVGPRLSMTGNNADLWIPVPPGGEFEVAAALLRIILDENLAPDLSPDRKAAVRALIGTAPASGLDRIGVSGDTLRAVARQFAAAERPLALAEGLGLTGPNPTETAVAANLLCTVKPGTREAIDFTARSALSDLPSTRHFLGVLDEMGQGDVQALLVHQANPAFSLPTPAGAAEKIRKVPFVVSFSSAPDETTELAHLVLPTHTPLESWGDYAPQEGVAGLLQPTMGPLFATKQLEDVLIAAGRALGAAGNLPDDSYEALRGAWARLASGEPAQRFWEESLARGGVWGRRPSGETGAQAGNTELVLSRPKPEPQAGSGLFFTTYPTVQFFDGRQANRPWIQELPDPMAQMTWDGWLEMHPETARKLGLERGDVVQVASDAGVVVVPVLPLPTVQLGTVAIPIGQGHTHYGRYATLRPANPMALFSPEIDQRTGGLAGPPVRVNLTPQGTTMPLAHVDGSLYQHDRGIAQVMALDSVRSRAAAGEKPNIIPPLPAAYNPERGDWYPPHEHVDYRWAMVVDLDRCIGCSACVVACYAENNVAVVGKDQVLKFREMSWLRIQRYFEEDRPRARWLPMLCQHCDSAPCESVCPVYAPHHSKEGLNNQVYNRCIGTRFCLQNDPYKVRRFNWFGFKVSKPLAYQLNPDVTARQKGVMEKCSFCIQRIVEAKIKARDEGRKVRDGEFTTACAQTCPTDTLIFGNLMDPESRVSKLINDTRAYQVLHHLNTKPAVIYLKRVTEVIRV